MRHNGYPHHFAVLARCCYLNKPYDRKASLEICRFVSQAPLISRFFIRNHVSCSPGCFSPPRCPRRCSQRCPRRCSQRCPRRCPRRSFQVLIGFKMATFLQPVRRFLPLTPDVSRFLPPLLSKPGSLIPSQTSPPTQLCLVPSPNRVSAKRIALSSSNNVTCPTDRPTDRPR